MTLLVELSIDWQQQAKEYLLQRRYDQAAILYEQAIDQNPEIRSHYWHLGLLLLLQEQEEEAQATWLFALSEVVPAEIEAAIQELVQILQSEAERREALSEYRTAWMIRQHWREMCPTDIDNLLRLVYLSIELGEFTNATLIEVGLVEQLQAGSSDINLELVQQVFGHVLQKAAPAPIIIEFVGACLRLLDPNDSLWILLPEIIRFGYSCICPAFAADLAEQYLQVDPDNLEVLSHLAPLYQNAKQYDRGVEVAQRRYELVDHIAEKVFSNKMMLRGLLGSGGRWQEALEIADRHETLLQTLIEEQPSLDAIQITRMLNLSYLLVYFKDAPQQWRSRQTQLLKFCQPQIQAHAGERGVFLHQPRQKSTRPLKIGYLSHCMCTHSVGWLARWLLKHHNHEQFEIHGYFINAVQVSDRLQDFYVQQVDHAHLFGPPNMEAHLEIAEQIYRDEIDILIDLDSLTLDISCEVLALKPAPIQVTWLGWDASGLPTIDYFIADPYVLPESAQDYYSEKIWRLPQTYIAIDGFEVDVPTLKREDLDIPDDAIIYLSAQTGYKRHRDTVKLQLQIIKQVPNSYLLIKGLSDQSAMQKFFLEVAAEEGVSPEQLRFLPTTPSSEIHRANLQIADIVLDTFPYNGATTTLETLWMGIPIVTRVGEQFAARNSYTMMMNVGITEGIAFSDREYIEWGVRLGIDAELRQSISFKLHQSKRSAPLWNGKQFAREMEQAYQQMWAIYTQS